MESLRIRKSVVVSNTTPLNYLTLIGRANILSSLYELVVIPEAVFNELTAPQLVREWITNKPAWLEVRQAPPTAVGDMEEIQIGERQAISLAQVIQADFVLLDDLRARRISKQRGITVVGTLGVLASAAQEGLINLKEAIEELRKTNFRVSAKLLESLLTEDYESQ